MFKFQELNSKVYHSSSFIVHISYGQCSTKSLAKGHPYGYVRRFAALKADVWGMCDGSHVKLNRLYMVFWVLASNDFKYRKDKKNSPQFTCELKCRSAQQLNYIEHCLSNCNHTCDFRQKRTKSIEDNSSPAFLTDFVSC